MDSFPSPPLVAVSRQPSSAGLFADAVVNVTAPPPTVYNPNPRTQPAPAPTVADAASSLQRYQRLFASLQKHHNGMRQHIPSDQQRDQRGGVREGSGHRGRLQANPGYGSEQIPRLARFICVLFGHVWSSNSLQETMDRKLNAFFVLFVQNVLEITRMPLPVITLAVKYVQRLRRHQAGLNPVLLPPPGDETRVFSVSLILAQKYSDDSPYGNRVWGQVLGLNAKELTISEMRFLDRIGFNLYVDEAEYIAFCRGVQALAREWNRSLQEVNAAGASRRASGVGSTPAMAMPAPLTPVSCEASPAVKEEERKRKAPDDTAVDPVPMPVTVPVPIIPVTTTILVRPSNPTPNPTIQLHPTRKIATLRIDTSRPTLPAATAVAPQHPFLSLPTLATPASLSPLPSLVPSTLESFTDASSKTYGLVLTPTPGAVTTVAALPSPVSAGAKDVVSPCMEVLAGKQAEGGEGNKRRRRVSQMDVVCLINPADEGVAK
ncbi:hypothetical protein HK101_009790 [Irineochytrium annulatum]|nr:hypothetical protein HK101_009790 [Irineochytrium annulatum]